MTKPAITKRVTKGSALTYSELDTNFQNLADATITVSDGTNSKALNLNDTIQFTAANNISLSVNSSTGVVTIGGSGGAGILNPLTSDLDLGSYSITDTSGFATVKSNGLTLQGTTYTTNSFTTSIEESLVRLKPLPLGLSMYIETQAASISLDGNNATSQVSLTANLTFASGRLRVGSYTDTTRDAATNPAVTNGEIIYNTTTHKFQGYANGTWVDLH